MVKKKSNSSIRRAPARRKPLKSKKPATAEEKDDVDILSEALNKTLGADLEPTVDEPSMGALKGISKKRAPKSNIRAKRAAKRKAVKVKAASAARKAKRRGIARN